MKEKTLGWSLKLSCLAGAAALLWSIQLFIPDFYVTLWHLTVEGDMNGLAEYVASFGYGAVIISILLLVISNMTGLPTIPFLTINGVIFGLVPGMVISWIGEVLGVEVGFRLTRTLFRDQAKKIIQKHNMLEKLDSYSCLRTMAIARAIPYSPNVLITALGALSRLSYKDHTIASIVGKIFPVIIEVWMGHDLIRFHEHGDRLIIMAALLIGAYLVYWWHKHTSSVGELEQADYTAISKK